MKVSFDVPDSLYRDLLQTAESRSIRVSDLIVRDLEDVWSERRQFLLAVDLLRRAGYSVNQIARSTRRYRFEVLEAFGILNLRNEYREEKKKIQKRVEKNG